MIIRKVLLFTSQCKVTIAFFLIEDQLLMSKMKISII